MDIKLCSAGSAVLWGSLSGVLAILVAAVAFSAWLWVTLRHRKEKQLLAYGVITCLRASDISSDSLSAGSSGQIKAASGSSAVSHSSIMLKDDAPTDRMKRVAKDITTWCLQRWGGPFGARAGSDSVGAKLGIWNERFESVRCAVMLLAFHKVNAALIAEHQKARTGTDEPGRSSLICPDSVIKVQHCTALPLIKEDYSDQHRIGDVILFMLMVLAISVSVLQ